MDKPCRKTLVLRLHDWFIVYDLSGCYTLFHASDGDAWGQTQKLPSRGVTYYSTLEGALLQLFRKLIIDNCQAETYKADIKSLRKAIEQAKAEFHDLLSIKKINWEDL